MTRPLNPTDLAANRPLRLVVTRTAGQSLRVRIIGAARGRCVSIEAGEAPDIGTANLTTAEARAFGRWLIAAAEGLDGARPVTPTSRKVMAETTERYRGVLERLAEK